MGALPDGRQRDGVAAMCYFPGMKSLRVICVLMVLLAVAVWSVAIFYPWPYKAEQRAMCDRSVAALLGSHDLVEVTRAGIIIERLNCGVARRLEKTP